MTCFAILLGGDLSVTTRLRRQIGKARIIAADSGMMHAAALGVTPELWVGDFDSAGSELALQYADVPRETFPTDKDATDGAIAIAEAMRRGASDFLLLGGLGGQTDHTAGLLGQSLDIARRGFRCCLSSGAEEAWPVVPGHLSIDVPAGSRLSIIPFSDLTGLSLTGVKWPLAEQTVGLGATLTLSNVVTGQVDIMLQAGHGVAIAYPLLAPND
ncbi:thiamine diphosphokinase [Aestuariivirga sp.]|uniref:thiamine diphosphokinase n=1 Tax=Aestuariivirga sp. TaxID=2650926 RepID=UPI00378327FD